MNTKIQLRRVIAAALAMCLTAALCGCGRRDTALTDAEASAIASISGIGASNFIDVSSAALTKERAAKFPAVNKVYKYQEMYAFISKPVGYNGPITLALVIDGGTGENMGLRIVQQNETPYYVRDMGSSWFTDRFADKSATGYLQLARLKANADNEIVAITGATVTTGAVINGVNAAFGVYKEYVLGQAADAVTYKVRFDPGEGDGPVETGTLEIRAYGQVLAEVSLDDIRAMPSAKRTMSIHSSSGTTQHSFTGTLLSNILNHADPGLTSEYDSILAVGVDDYSSDVSMDEVKAENNVYVMYEDNGLPLLRKNGESGGMRIVVLDDVFGQRYTNYLLQIELENEGLS